MDSLIRKACELGEKTTHCSVEVILNATRWMEEKYRDAQRQDRGDDRFALFDARHQERVPDKPQVIEEHIARALHWWRSWPAAINVGIHLPRDHKNQQTKINKQKRKQIR